jgi:hypothetical protein
MYLPVKPFTNSTESIAVPSCALNRFLHRRWQVSPAVNNLTHRFFDGSQHISSIALSRQVLAIALSPVRPMGTQQKNGSGNIFTKGIRPQSPSI